MADIKRKTLSDFSPASTEQWMEKVTADLKGRFEKKLVGKQTKGLSETFLPDGDLEDLKTTDALPGEFPLFKRTKKTTMQGWLSSGN
jgi:methylmalonyl-CoA mutase